MKKLFLLLTLSAFCTTNALAQAAHQYKLYGSYIDLDGQLIHERADQDYSPIKSLSVTVNSATDFIPGEYYTAAGKAEKGMFLITTSNNSFSFKKSNADEEQRITPEHGWSIKVGADSFIVASGFPIYNKIGPTAQEAIEPRILRFIGKSGKFAFFSHSTGTGAQHYLIRDLQTNKLISLPLQQKSFIEKATALFKDYPLLVELLQNKGIKSDQVVDLMRFIQYSDAQKLDATIGYAANWEITDNPKKQLYTAKVSRPEKNWRLDFYDQAGHKLFTEHYAYASPSKNDGETLWYYPATGVTRKKTKFVMGESSKEFFIYYPNGKLHYQYLIDDLKKVIYRNVVSEKGEYVLYPAGSGREEFYDETAKRTIIREFEKNVLIASYYLDQNNRKIYQYAQQNLKIRSLKAFNLKLAESDHYPESAVSAGEEGVVLVKFIIAPDDQIESYTILQGVSTFVDIEASNLAMNLSSTDFKSGRHAKQEVYQEVIVPIQFSLHRQSVNRYYYHNPFWMNHQFYQPAFVPPTPPSMPR